MKNIFSAFLIMFIFSCSKKQPYLEYQKKAINLRNNITVFNNRNETISFDFGMWMFNERKLEVDAIANWIGIKQKGKSILEPINIIWVDYKANTKNEARENITTFLNANDFLIRNGSSVGYYGLFENNNWIPQYKETWSDKEDPKTINNHGRIFPAHKITSNLNNPVFVSTGAFSIEDELHYLVSFNDALKKMKETKEWKVFRNRFKAANIIQEHNYTTFDHEGIIVFVLN